MKHFSKTFSVPPCETVFQNRQLLQTMEEVAQREEQYMREKLMREEEIQNRLKQLQAAYELEALKKQQKTKAKLQKSQKNRLQFLEKIVKRCKEKDRIFQEKIKMTNSQRKNFLKQAWKEATKFNQKILESRIIRHKSFDRSYQMPKQAAKENGNKSLMIPDHIHSENKLQPPGSGIRSNSKQGQSAFANRSLIKTHDQTNNFQSTFLVEQKMQKFQRPINISINNPERNCQTEQSSQNPYQQKLRRTLIRHQQNLMDEESKKIQDIGERLEKINLSRRKRDQMHKSRLKKSLNNGKGDYYNDSDARNEDKSKKKSNQRIKSQSQNNYKQRRASDWSELNKQRRQQYLHAQIQQGNQYLSENKMRYLKETMSKSIVYNALERKLYQQRFRHQ